MAIDNYSKNQNKNNKNRRKNPQCPDDACSTRKIERLDTLRALAVIFVFIFHLQPDILKWGYIGVDMFFSLSGFLMTFLYLQAQHKGAAFPASSFIVRRFWRIFPPLAIVVLVSLIMSALLMAPSHLLASAESGLAALLSLSNWYFFQEAGYFDLEAIVKPFLHTWSLGVEEQFYAIFAVALLLTRWITLKLILVLVTLGSLGSWGMAVLGELEIGFPSLHDEPFSALFFLPQYRVFQFSLGGLAAYGMRYSFKGLGVFGLIFLSAAAITASNNEWAHLAAPLVTIGMCAVMIRAPLLDTVSKLRPIAYLAKVSYQLYLVHWPVIVLWQYVTLSHLNWLEALLCAALCIALTDGLYRLTNAMRST